MENGELNKILIKFASTHFRRSRNKLSKEGISRGQPRILNYLIENDGCIQRELSKCCSVEPATITSILCSMEKSGLIYRKANENDKRILNVFITDKGIKAQKKVLDVFVELENECFKGFTKEEKEDAVIVLNRIYNNMIEGEEIND